MQHSLQPCHQPRGRLRYWRSRSAAPNLAAAAALLLSAATAQAQTATLTGRVLGEGDKPLTAAVVELVGTPRNTSTDVRGTFTLRNVLAGTHQVRARALGYRALTLSATVVGGETDTLDFRLTPSAIRLDELVVTGQAGATERRAIGNVVSAIDVASVVEAAPIRDMQSLLNARAPGLVITPGTGQVGSGSQIRIRGSSSLSLENTPLLYVDGVRVDNVQNSGPVVQAFGSSVISRINDFNPNDIESIEVIKGPAAATLYGTEAASGVIQIITKRGREGKPTWDFSFRQGANWFDNAESRVPVNYWRNPATNQIESLNLAASESQRGRPLWRTGHVQNYGLSLSGGTPEARYYLAGNFDQEEGADRMNEASRSGARANLSVLASPTLEIRTTAGYTRNRSDLACEAGCGGTTWASYFSTPFHLGTNDPARVQLPDGSDRRRGSRSFAPEVYETTEYFQEVGRFTGSLQFNHTPGARFSQRLTFGIDDTREDNQVITEIGPLYKEWNPSGQGSKSVGRRDVTYKNADYAGTLSFSLRPDLTSRTSLGGQYYNRLTKFVNANGSDFALPGLRVINATATRTGSETFVEETSLGVYVQQQFGWKDRRFLTLALRADDHSAFGSNFSLVYYPKVSAAWVVSEEPFWNFGAVDELRLRGAFGRAGKQPGAFDALRTFSAVAGPGDAPTVTPGSVGNPELGPERGQELELGFEAGFLKDRLGLEFTWYNKRTLDAILLQPVAPSTGFSEARFVNIGEIKNYGFEAVLRATPVATRTVAWDASLSVGRNDSKVVDLGGLAPISVGFGVMHKEGFPVAGWHHFRVVDAQFDPVTHQAIRSSMMCDDDAGGSTPCYQGNTIVAPRVFLGRSEPLFEGAFTSTVTLFDRIRVYGMLDYKTGFRKWDHVLRVRCSLNNTCLESRQGTIGLVDPSILQSERFQNDASYRATLAAYQNGDSFGFAYINDASFLRLREISLSYALPQRLIRGMGASQATITMSARNLGTWTDWTGLDPEARFLGGARGLFGGLEQNHLPQLTSFMTTINLTF